MKKKRCIAVSVTTLEALTNSLADALPVICIEEPLYPSIKNNLAQLPLIEDYQIEEYVHKCFIMLTKFQGINRIDPGQCKIYYFPLTY